MFIFNNLTDSPGIGLAAANHLLAAPQSHNVVVVARSREPLQNLKSQYPKQVEVLNGDLGDLSLPQKAVDLALKSFGRLDGMVLNHGILGQMAKIANADVKQWKDGLDVNFISMVAFVSGLGGRLWIYVLTSSGPSGSAGSP